MRPSFQSVHLATHSKPWRFWCLCDTSFYQNNNTEYNP